MECNCGCKHVEKESEKDIRIVILQRGWVMVGEFKQVYRTCSLTDASVIRVWGTEKGLGELINGPKEKTILDPCGYVEFHQLTMVANIKAKASKWDLK